jgi:tRNA/tmRNA/rRNA uracil-C5-methylase (TrmA/RlmC/RlmD family)
MTDSVCEDVELTIADVVYQGRGLARWNGCVVFVPHVLPGETVRARLVRRRRNYAEAKLLDVLQASPARVEPVCPLAGVCPGCSYQHADYAEELRLKQAQLANLLERQAGIGSAPCPPPIGSPAVLGYRNKITLHSDSPRDPAIIGYVGEDNRTLIPLERCPLAVDPLNALLGTLRQDPGLSRRLRPHAPLTLRHTEKDGALFWIGSPDVRAPWLTESTRIGDVTAPRDSFFQVNPSVANLLLDHVTQVLRDVAPDTLIDLYCGVGLFALAAGRAGISRVVGVDCDPAAVDAANRNARAMGLDGLTFLARTAGRGLRQAFAAIAPERNVLILDPPRRGLDRRVLTELIRRHPANILYISCAADTLARDIALLTPAGYDVKQVQLLDMFPRTPYFESVAWLTAGRAPRAA